MKKIFFKATSYWLISAFFFNICFGGIPFFGKQRAAKAANVEINCTSTPSIAQGVDFNSGDNVTLATGSGACTLSADATFGTLDITAETELVLSGATVTADTVYIRTDGVISHTAANKIGINITVTTLFDVESGGLVYGDFLGCPATQGPNASGDCANVKGYAQGGDISGVGGEGGDSDYTGGGAGHGGAGAGGAGPSYGGGGGAYGSPANPTLLGSGGGNATVTGQTTGQPGGGLIRISTTNGTINVSGSITANGQQGLAVSSAYAGGGASGGSIYLSANIFSGSGTITANGGTASSYSGSYGGGGGGGRIAIYYLSASGTAYSGATANGGAGATSSYNGSNGSVYTLQSTVPTTPSLTAPLPSSYNNGQNLMLTSSSYDSNGLAHLTSDWKVTSDAEGNTLVWTDTDDAVQLETTYVTSSDGTFTTIGQTTLNSNTTYYAFVRHSNSKGDSSWSSGVAFTTSYAISGKTSVWAFDDATPATNFSYNNAIISINEGSDGLGKLIDLGGGAYKTPALANYTKRQAITINNTGTAQTNYQVALTVTYDSDMQSDFDDLRFTREDMLTEIDYWIESYTPSTSATVYVEVPSIPSGGTTIYMYYGNAVVSTTSNGTNTFSLFEDMTSSPTGTLQNSATYDADNDYVQLTAATNSIDGELYYTLDTGANYMALFSFWSGGGNGADATWFHNYATSIGITPATANGGYTVSFDEYNSNQIQLKWNGSTVSLATDTNIDNSEWRKVKVTYEGVNTNVYLDGTLKINYIDAIRTKTGTYLGFGANTGGLNNYHRIKNVAIGKFSSDVSAEFAAEITITNGTTSYDDLKIQVVADGWDPMYTKLLTFSTSAGGSNAGTFKYQISNNGTNWYYHNGSAWTAVVTDSLHNNTVSQINSYLFSFPSEINTGNFYFKIFLISNGTQATEISSAQLGYDDGAPIMMADFVRASGTSTSATFTWTAGVDDAFDHYEIWYGMNQLDVQGRTGSATEWDNSDDGLLTTSSTTTTTITGLTPGETYYAKIWAVDLFSQEATLSDISFNTNQVPTAASVTAAQRTDGSGKVDIQFTIDDADDDDTLQATVGYYDADIGGFVPATLSTEDSDTTATYGDPGVDNSGDYQVGTGDEPIISSSGANTINVVWNSQSNLPAGDLADAQIQVVPYDGAGTGTEEYSAIFTLDNVNPTFTGVLSSTVVSAETVSFTWSAASDTNFNHYEIWYGTVQADVEGRTGTATEWDNSDDDNLLLAATLTTTINNFASGLTYYAKIWAVDVGGNITSLNTITVVTNSAPTISSGSASLKTNGTKKMDIQTVVSDANSDGLKLLVQYNFGGVLTQATLDTADDATTATAGDPDIDNSASYQVGTGANMILTSGGANTVNFDIDLTALAATEITNGTVYITANDGTVDSTTYTISNVTVDTKVPVMAVSLPAGNYSGTQSATITATDANTTTIYYTLDGTTPSTSNYLGTGTTSVAVPITQSVTLKYIGIDYYGNTSAVGSAAYTLYGSSITVTISAPEALLVTNATTMEVTGTINDSYGNSISSVTVNGVSAAYAAGIFTSGISIVNPDGVDGEFAINVIATNSEGDTGNASVNIIKDTLPAGVPTILTTTTATSQSTILIQGTKDVLSGIYLSDGTQVVALNGLSTWSTTMELSEGTNTYAFKSIDSVGNFSALVTYVVGYNPLNPLQSIVLSVTVPANIYEGSALQITATGTYYDETEADLSSLVSWINTANLVGSISDLGLYTGLKAGISTVTASLGDMLSDNLSVIVAARGGTSGVATITYNSDGVSVSADGTAVSGADTAGNVNGVASINPTISPSASPTVSPTVIPTVSADPVVVTPPAPENVIPLTEQPKIPRYVVEPAQANELPKYVKDAMKVEGTAEEAKKETKSEEVKQEKAVTTEPEIKTTETKTGTTETSPVPKASPETSPAPIVILNKETAVVAPILAAPVSSGGIIGGSGTVNIEPPKTDNKEIKVEPQLLTTLIGYVAVNEAETADDLANCPDSDGDGTSDCKEEILGSNPYDKEQKPEFETVKTEDGRDKEVPAVWMKVYDVKNEEVGRCDIDSDADGLSNCQEMEIGSNPKSKDTDGDGILDGIEVNVMNSNILRGEDLNTLIAEKPNTNTLKDKMKLKSLNSGITGTAPRGAQVNMYVMDAKGVKVKVGSTVADNNNAYLLNPAIGDEFDLKGSVVHAAEVKKNLPNGTYKVWTETVVSHSQAKELMKLKENSEAERMQYLSTIYSESQNLSLLVDSEKSYLKFTKPINVSNLKYFVTITKQGKKIPFEVREASIKDYLEYWTLNAEEDLTETDIMRKGKELEGLKELGALGYRTDNALAQEVASLVIVDYSHTAKTAGKYRIDIAGGIRSLFGDLMTSHATSFNFKVQNSAERSALSALKASALAADAVTFVSEEKEIVIDSGMDIEEPTPIKLDNQEISEKNLMNNVRVVVDNKRPILEGVFEKEDLSGKRTVVANWKSLLLTSSIIADSKAGDFRIFAPSDLEPGEHTVYLHALYDKEDDKVRSEEIKVTFVVPNGGIKSYILWIVLGTLALIFIAGTIVAMKKRNFKPTGV